MNNIDQNENPMMRNANYRRLLNEKNKLIKRVNFAEQRLEKYGYALSDQEVNLLQQRIAATVEQLADINDKMADLEDGNDAPVIERFSGHASKALKDASRAANQAAFAAYQANRR